MKTVISVLIDIAVKMDGVRVRVGPEWPFVDAMSMVYHIGRLLRSTGISLCTAVNDAEIWHSPSVPPPKCRWNQYGGCTHALVPEKWGGS